MANPTDKPADMLSRLRAATALAEEITRLESEAGTKRQQLNELVGSDLATTPALTELGANVFPINAQEDDYGRWTSKVLAFLRANKGRPMQGADVAKAIKHVDANIVRSLMNRLAKQGKIKKVSRGRYVAS